MKVDIHPQLGDGIPNMLWQAHEIGNIMESTNSQPCKVCLAESGEIHFHGSEFGECARKVYRKRKLRDHTSGISGANFLNDGHLHEKGMLEHIKRGLPDEYKIKIAENTIEGAFNIGDFRLIGHVDAFLQTPDGLYGLECKAVKEAMWKQIKNEQEISDVWYGQAQAYMVIFDIARWYFIVKHRESSNILMPIRIDKDIAYDAARLNKLSDIFNRLTSGQGQPDREHQHPKEYECLWCPYGKNVGNNSCWDEEVEQMELLIPKLENAK